MTSWIANLRWKQNLWYPVGAIYCFTMVFGLVVIQYLKPDGQLNQLAIGSHAIFMLIPVASVATALAILLILGKYEIRDVFGLLLLYIILSASLQEYYFDPVWHYYFDDPGRYSNYARIILLEKTLWGGDAVASIGQNVPYYVDQPGFRYFLALSSAIFFGENRLMQLANILIYVTSVSIFILSVRSILSARTYVCVSMFFVLSLIYAAINVMEGLSEWLSVSFFLIGIACFMNKKIVIGTVLLATTPFIRQNLLLIAIFVEVIVLLYVSSKENRSAAFLLFIVVLGLPIYHNLFYAEELRFFTSNRGYIVGWSSNLIQIIGNVFEVLSWKIPEYFGYYPTASGLRTLVTVVFAPFGTLLILYSVIRLNWRLRLLLSSAIIITLGPTMLFGWGYFPRFVYLNQAVLIATIPLLLNLRGALLETPRKTVLH